MIIFSSHRMDHVELFCKKLVVLVNGKSVLEGYISDIKKNFRKKNIEICSDIKKEDLLKIKGIEQVIEKSSEFEVKISSDSIIDDVFKVVSKSKNVTKFLVQEPSLNEIFVAKVGESYEK